MIDVDYLHEPLDWRNKQCDGCANDLEEQSAGSPDPVVVSIIRRITPDVAKITLCGDCRYKLARLLS